MTPIMTSLACWPGLTHMAGAAAAMSGVREPLTGALHTDHVQLVPQSADVLDEALAEVMAKTWPSTTFRLHANVRVMPRRRLADLCTFERDLDWFTAAARVHHVLGADTYSAHAGLRRDASFAELLDNARRCSDLFGCEVAIEGQYPIAGAEPHKLLVSTWPEYQSLLDSGVPYALDLSHLNIVAHGTGRREDGLVADMLASPKCREVHISANDGRGDWHQVVRKETWWWPLLHHIHADAVIFSEGNHRHPHPERNFHDPQ